MLEFLRRQSKPIMIAVAAIIIIAFTFWSGMTQPGRGGYSAEATSLSVNGRDYSFLEVGRLQHAFVFAQQAGLPGVGPSYASDMVGIHFQHASQKTGRPLVYESAPFDYGINVLVLRDALKRFGIRASDKEVQDAYRKLPTFFTNGQYNPELARGFEQWIRERGVSQEQMYDTIRDSLGLQRLQQIVAGNMVSAPGITDRFYAASFSTIKAATIPFPLDDFKKKVEVKDEEISKYFEENKEGYKTEEKRAVTLVVLPKPDTATLNAENTVKAQREYEEKVQKFAEKVLDSKINLAAEATEAKAEVRQIAAFADTAPPEELKNELALVNAIFTNDQKLAPISDPVKVAKGYAFFQVTAVEAPKTQELKDVKEKIREALVSQKATEAMTKAANEARTKLEAAIKGGKSFADAAKEAGLTPQVLAEFSTANPPMNLSIGYRIAQEAQSTAPGSFAKEILNSENGVLLLFVLSKELRKSPESAASKNMISTSLDRMAQQDIFRAWFEEQYKNAKVNASILLNVALSNER
ncbi:parvulin-like peptidyl-prolyl cis-trans isomerase protein [Roseimicrobium gellanilyticum]|uniref:Periplasmic chaperone PpiD n=1 Tax=Roseimicrobium gellanilyticum TaxID=748857 RepID=A0A366HUL6_9BACT|nr:SurA N-terminal domain-containing protein [Roseimicrobium gellanilyticum]RBP47369.1 parvulin-like peptidyl-prolyl cis-trans isomerase protein [Roseimicrobium gellanilyticum]